ncbi:MAG: preprotein translocase subunit SecG [Acholeplasmatales bacterium]|jgi:preprotein translocase subunit SecG|nr:preprotein translocase subunit SecG [Acholeplasmatales bacterium]
MIWVDYLIIPVMLVLIIASLLQEPADDAYGAFSGEKSDLFKNKKLRGSELFLNYTIIVSVVLFIILTVVSNSIDIRW